MTVYRSQDGGRTWPGFTVVAQGGASYSCMSQLPKDPNRLALLCTPQPSEPHGRSFAAELSADV